MFSAHILFQQLYAALANAAAASALHAVPTSYAQKLEVANQSIPFSSVDALQAKSIPPKWLN